MKDSISCFISKRKSGLFCVIKKSITPLARDVGAATDSKAYDVILTAYNFKQKHYLEVREAIAKAAHSGLGIVGMKAIRGGSRQTPAGKNAAAALKWVLQDMNVHIVVPGFTTFEEMNIDLEVMEDLRFTEDEKEALQKEASIPSLYCQGCRQCLGQCPEHSNP